MGPPGWCGWMSSQMVKHLQAARVGGSILLQSSHLLLSCAQRARLLYISYTSSERQCPLKNTSLTLTLQEDKHCPLCQGSPVSISSSLLSSNAGEGSPAPGDLKEHPGGSNPSGEEVFRDANVPWHQGHWRRTSQVGEAEMGSFYCHLGRLAVQEIPNKEGKEFQIRILEGLTHILGLLDIFF